MTQKYFVCYNDFRHIKNKKDTKSIIIENKKGVQMPTIAEFKKNKKKQKNLPKQKIHNNFIDNTIHNSNLQALKTMYYLSTVFEKMKFDNEITKIDLDLQEMLEATKMSKIDIRTNLKKLQKTSISFIDEENQIEEGIALLPKYKVFWGTNKVEIDIYTKIANLIIDVTKNYTFLNTEEIMAFKNKHTIRLLALLHKINNYDDYVGKRKTLDLEELQEFFDIKYKRLHEVSRKILDKVKEDLDNEDATKLSFIYQLNYEKQEKGRPKAVSITIDLIEKEPNLFTIQK